MKKYEQTQDFIENLRLKITNFQLLQVPPRPAPQSCGDRRRRLRHVLVPARRRGLVVGLQDRGAICRLLIIPRSFRAAVPEQREGAADVLTPGISRRVESEAQSNEIKTAKSILELQIATVSRPC